MTTTTSRRTHRRSAATARSARVLPLYEGQRASEVVFVPRSPGAPEGDGYGLSMIYDGKSDTTHLAVIDTARWEDGPIARCHFETHLPMSFHGTWLPKAVSAA